MWHFAAQAYNTEKAKVSIVQPPDSDGDDIMHQDVVEVARASELVLSALPGRGPDHSAVICTSCCQQLCTCYDATKRVALCA